MRVIGRNYATTDGCSYNQLRRLSFVREQVLGGGGMYWEDYFTNCEELRTSMDPDFEVFLSLGEFLELTDIDESASSAELAAFADGVLEVWDEVKDQI